MNIKDIQTIMKDFEKSSLMVLELETDDFKLKLSKNKTDGFVVIKEEQTTEAKNTIKEPNYDKTPVLSPLVGTFYSNNDKGPLVSVGKKINKGDVVGIIEAMKIFNEITAPTDGVVREILVANGSVVGFHDVLMMIGPEHEK